MEFLISFFWMMGTSSKGISTPMSPRAIIMPSETRKISSILATPSLIKNRGVFLLILTAAAGTRYRKSAVILTVIWLGFCVGMVICTAIARLGIKGIVLCVIAVMPQGVFYILSGILLFEYMLNILWSGGIPEKL